MNKSVFNFYFTVAIVKEKNYQNKLKIEKLPFWTKFEALGDQLLRISYHYN